MWLICAGLMDSHMILIKMLANLHYKGTCHPRLTPLRHKKGRLRMPQNFAHLFGGLFRIYSRFYLSRESIWPYHCGVWKGKTKVPLGYMRRSAHMMNGNSQPPKCENYELPQTLPKATATTMFTLKNTYRDFWDSTRPFFIPF